VPSRSPRCRGRGTVIETDLTGVYRFCHAAAHGFVKARAGNRTERAAPLRPRRAENLAAALTKDTVGLAETAGRFDEPVPLPRARVARARVA
jgi:hypothetical protein